MKVIKTTGRIISLILTILIAFILVCNLYTIAARYIGGRQQPAVFGFSTAVVISGSMSGCLEVNDMVIIREAKDYSVGDVVTFKSGENLVTHRIIARQGEGFVTKGDANNTPDLDLLDPGLIVGRVVAVIPGVGKAIEFMRTPLGIMCVVAVGFALYYVPTLFERNEREKGGAAGENQEQGRSAQDE